MDLHRALKVELEVLWSDLRGSLPRQSGAGVGSATALADAFHGQMVHLWTRTQTFELVKAAEGNAGDLAARASLISRVRAQARDYLSGAKLPDKRERWQEVQRAFDAWWRPWESPEAEVRILLAMRHRLQHQAGVALAGVRDQATLTELGMAYGVLQAQPTVPTVLSGGKRRLAVLALDITEELLEMPLDEDPPLAEGQPEGGEAQ
jgi:hypothetical protein